jgi:recombinational DNA repair protein RecR
MYANYQKRFYSPQFSEVSAVSIRRLAWSLGISMPKAVDQVVNALPSIFSPGTVCLSCKDQTKCKSCAFSQQPAAEQAAPAV